jgi:allantoinase
VSNPYSASHNYRWIDYSKLSEETEREHVRLAVKSIQNASVNSRAPVGFYTGRIGTQTRRIVWEEFQKMALPLLYESDAYNDDLVRYVFTTALLGRR